MSESNKNVVVFGESGSGKSSLVNLLLGQDEANVSDKAVGCTFNFKKYTTPNFSLYDTVGLSEGSAGTLKQSQAIKQLIKLIKSLDDGVSLLIFVVEKGRIKKSLEDNYKLFIDVICRNKVPVVLAITHCEMESKRGAWWAENKEHFEKYGMKFDAVVSGTALRPSAAPEIMQTVIKALNNTTFEELFRAIITNLLHKAWKFEGGWFDWFLTILDGMASVLFKVLGVTSGTNFVLSSQIERRLFQYFQSQGLSYDEAMAMAKEVAQDAT